MNRKFMSCFFVAMGALLLTATNSFSFSSFGDAVNAACTPTVVFTGDCSLCHTGAFSAPTPAKDAALAGGTTLTDFFCMPTGPTCTDNDGDTYAVEGGECGAVDCDDTNAAVNPGAVENCTDNIDNNCNGLIDTQDPNAVGCPLVCTDLDGDTYAVEGGACGPVDCNDTDPAVNPAAVEVCGDTVDNNCNANIDERCRLTCPAGAWMVIKSIQYNRADHKKLTIKGRAFVKGQSAVGTTLTFIDTDSGNVLKDGIAVKNADGLWKVKIKRVKPTLRRITIQSSNGCTQIERLDRSIYQ